MNNIKGFSKKPQCSEEQLLEVKEAFNVFDSEQTGGLDARELKAAITALNIKISKEEIKNIYQEFGKDIREKITLEEFMEIVIPRLPDRHSKEYIQKIFQYFDLENTGKITSRHLKKIAQEIGENLSDEELREIMEEADRDGDGYIGFDDFYRIMKNINNINEIGFLCKSLTKLDLGNFNQKNFNSMNKFLFKLNK